ncbi:MAG: rRNA adenine N-6-methyltransferase family protein, partial [Candidatus Azambacteria bacterium]|nr:rRNA adenine N-6-methyltransferase family protein [Candidatus Azambacteria bacterium]
PAEAFWPRPKVDSAIIKIIPNLPARTGKAAFFKVVKAGFSQPRKQLASNLAKKLELTKEKILSAFKKLGIPELSRAENLSIEQWVSLSISLHLPAQRK